jgi:uncharacterized protein (TIGR02646 family)
VRRLVKGLCPEILQQKSEIWTNEYLDCLANGTKPSDTQKNRYRHLQIKQAIIQETYGKCAYCESKVTHVYPGDIEHIKPKSLHPRKIFSWENLTLSCSVCNTNKRDYPNDTEPLIHPYNDEPCEHIIFSGPMLIYCRGSSKGFLTSKKLDLNRASLIERRKEKIESLLIFIQLWDAQQPGAMKDFLRSQILEECKPDKEFSFMVECFITTEYPTLRTGAPQTNP